MRKETDETWFKSFVLSWSLTLKLESDHTWVQLEADNRLSCPGAARCLPVTCPPFDLGGPKETATVYVTSQLVHSGLFFILAPCLFTSSHKISAAVAVHTIQSNPFFLTPRLAISHFNWMHFSFMKTEVEVWRRELSPPNFKLLKKVTDHRLVTLWLNCFSKGISFDFPALKIWDQSDHWPKSDGRKVYLTRSFFLQ